MSKLAGRTDGAEVIGLAALPKSPPVRIVLPLGVPAGTDLRIDAEVDRNIHQIGQFRTRGVNALQDDHISGRNDLRRCQPAVIGVPVIGLERGRLPGSQGQQRLSRSRSQSITASTTAASDIASRCATLSLGSVFR